MKIIMGLLLSLCLSATAHAATNKTTERINGVSQFLIDRANENYLYIFEKSIKDNTTLKCYFSNTKENLDVAGLKELLISKQLWDDSLKKDLDTLLTRSTARYIEKTFSVSKLASELWGRYIEMLQFLEVKNNDTYHRLDMIPVDADKKLKELVNSFYDTSNSINSALSYFGKFNKVKLCDTPVISRELFLENINAVYKIDESVKAIIALFKGHIKNKSLRVTSSASNELKRDVIGYIKQELSKVNKQNNNIKQDIKSLIELSNLFKDEKVNNTVKVVSAFKALRDHSALGDDDYNKLKKHVLFFAQISDADNSDEASAVLKSYTLPSVSFFEKRNRNGKWLINSYLGVALGNSDVPSGENDNNSTGVYAPIGLEYSQTAGKGQSVSYMVAPFDFGYPVSLKLNGIESEVEFDEIVAPSAAITYGFKDSPVAIGLVLQKGRTFTVSGKQEKRVFIHISFDMPLFILK